MGPALCPTGPDWVTCPFLGLALTGIPWREADICPRAETVRPQPTAAGRQRRVGCTLGARSCPPGAVYRSVPQLGPCSRAEFNTVQGSEFCLHDVSLESPTQKGPYINSASTFPTGPGSPISWPLLHALAIPGSEISRVLLRKYTRTAKEGGTHRQTLESWEVVKNRGDLVGMGL